MLKHLGNLLGILTQPPEVFLKDISNEGQQSIESLIRDREIARDNKNWNDADRIRDELLKMGVILEDKPTGETIWHLKIKNNS